MKPDTKTAMEMLITQVRDVMPFDLPLAYLCAGKCNGCSQKLLDYLDAELEHWEDRLSVGEVPDLADLSRMAKISKKVYRVLEKNKQV